MFASFEMITLKDEEEKVNGTVQPNFLLLLLHHLRLEGCITLLSISSLET